MRSDETERGREYGELLHVPVICVLLEAMMVVSDPALASREGASVTRSSNIAIMATCEIQKRGKGRDL